MADGVCVHPAIVDLVWPKVSHLIRLAVEQDSIGRFDVVEANVLKGASILWLAVVDNQIRGALVTQMQTTERSKACEIIACGGDGFSEWADLLSMIENYARLFGCNRVRFTGRKGWARLIKGYTVEQVVMERLI